MGGDEKLQPEQIELLLGAAGAAPSMHNTQPWWFDVNGHVIDVYLDGSRTLPAEDPKGRAMRIGIGAAVFNLRVAAAHLGLDSWFGLVPDPDEPGLLARVVVAPSMASVPSLGLLYGEIARRHTDRAPARPVDIPAADRIELQRAAFAEGVELTWLPENSVDRILWLVVNADLRGILDTDRIAERRHWIGGARTVDGIPHSALGPRSTAYPSVVRDLSATPRERMRPTARFELTPLLATLSTDGDGPRDHLTAGMALERVLLTATRLGLSASFLNQALEYDELRTHVQELTGKPGHTHMLMRFLPSVQHEPTPRRPVADFYGPAPS